MPIIVANTVRLERVRRSSWRDSDVTVTGDTELAARFLDAVNVI